MPNEVRLIISLLVAFSSLILVQKFLGKTGVYAWIAICTILADVEVTILVRAFGLEQTLGNTLFAATFLATDILSEIYGKKESRNGAIVGILSTVAFMFFSFLWQGYIPSENDWAIPFVKGLFANTPRMLLASLVAYAISEILDVNLYHWIWDFTEKRSGSREKFLWLRNNCATLISQFVNIVIFNFGAFIGIYDWPTLLQVTASCYLIYVFTSLLDTPFIYLARKINKV